MMKSQFINVRVTPEVAKRLHEIATKHGTTRSKLIREFMENADAFDRFLESEKRREQRKSDERFHRLFETLVEVVSIKHVSRDDVNLIGDVAYQAAEEMPGTKTEGDDLKR
jgi:predicted DNA-binding protein